MATGIILNQFVIFALLMLVGVIAAKTGIIKEESKAFLSRLIIDVTLPFLIFSTFSHVESNVKLLTNASFIFVLTFVNLIFLYTAGSLSSKMQRLAPPQATIHTLHTMFGNIVFLGFPLFDALFPGGIGVFYAAVYQLASNSVTFTYGIYKLSSGTKKTGYKSLLNVNTGALLLGVLIMLSGLKLPGVVQDAFTGIGKCTSPLSMIYIGALLAGIKLKDTIRTFSIYILSFSKLLLMPVLLGFMYFYLIKFLNLDISREAFLILVMQAGMPCQTIVVVMTQRYGGDYKLATGNLFITTILSILSLPFLYYFLDQVFFYTNH